MATNSYPQSLRFQRLSSAIEVSFWQKLSKLKLDEYMLDEGPKRIIGSYGPSRSTSVPSRVKLSGTHSSKQVLLGKIMYLLRANVLHKVRFSISTLSKPLKLPIKVAF